MDARDWDDKLGKWFRGLEKIAAGYPELYPHGIISGVLLKISQDVDSDPGIAPDVPEHIVTAVQALHAGLFSTR